MTTARRTLTVPPFYCPLPEARYGRPDEIDEAAVAWVLDRGVRDRGDRMTAMKAGWYLACCLPRLRDEPAVPLLNLLYWATAWDDDLDTTPGLDQPAGMVRHVARLRRAMAYPEAALPPDQPLLRSFQEIWRGLAAHSTPGQLAQFRQGFCDYLDGVLWKSVNQATGELPELGDYLIMRANDVAGPWLSVLTQIGAGYELTARELAHPGVRACVEAMSVLVGLDNDLLSRHKERLFGVFDQDAVAVMRRDHACPVDEAVEHVRALRDRIMTLYLRLRDQLAADAGPVVARFVHDIGYWVRGQIVWAAFTSRYSRPVDPSTGEEVEFGGFGPRWADAPADPDPSPPAVAQIAWWWEQLDR
ncbi:terpene synthase family protein [Streptomyces sp. NPDC057638]|uniref:terpene synthase family protein n=1 Tax=Streptomyces sp. NPDC057638 TaxID=3346190 RepID=UPI0036C8CB08